MDFRVDHLDEGERGFFDGFLLLQHIEIVLFEMPVGLTIDKDRRSEISPLVFLLLENDLIAWPLLVLGGLQEIEDETQNRFHGHILLDDARMAKVREDPIDLYLGLDDRLHIRSRFGNSPFLQQDALLLTRSVEEQEGEKLVTREEPVALIVQHVLEHCELIGHLEHDLVQEVKPAEIVVPGDRLSHELIVDLVVVGALL